MKTDIPDHQHHVTTWGACRRIRVMDGTRLLLERFDHGAKVALIRVAGGWGDDAVAAYQRQMTGEGNHDGYRFKDFGDMDGFLHFVEHNGDKLGEEFRDAVRELIVNRDVAA